MESFGWCEPCTYNTLASTGETDFPSWEQYLNENKIPIVDASDGGVFSSLVSLLNFGGISTGPLIVNVANITYNAQTETTIPSTETIVSRINILKSLCDSCLPAVYINSSSNLQSREQRTNYILSALFDKNGSNSIYKTDCNPSKYNDGDSPCNSALMENLSIILFDFYPINSQIFFSTNEKHCSAPKNWIHNIVFSRLTNQSQYILEHFNKPSIAYNFGYTYDSECFRKDVVADNLAFILLNQKNLTASGLIGLRYSSVFRPDSVSGSGHLYPAYKSGGNRIFFEDTFSQVESASQYIKYNIPNYIYQKIPAVDSVDCVLKSGFEDYDNNNGGTLECLSGGNCILPSPMPAGNGANNYTCPDNTILNSHCTPCDSLVYNNIKCDLESTPFDTKHYSINPSDLSDMYKEVIANLPDGNVCCLSDENGNNYTYISRDISATQSLPIRYSAWSDEKNGCSLNKLDNLNNFCGVNLPVSIEHYSVNCTGQP